MNNPLDTDQFTFFLEFQDAGFPTEYEITEPIGWDSANFINEQEPKRWARSIDYGAVDKLTFADIYGVGIIPSRAINPQGDSFDHLDCGLQWLLSGYKAKGFQFKVNFVLKKNGLLFNLQQLDFTEKDITDGYTYLSCKLIQKNKVANLKRRLDDKFNLFGVVDSKNNAITPAPTIDFLRKATPIRNSSEWTQKQQIIKVAGNNTGTFNGARQINLSEINNTLTPFSENSSTITSSFPNAVKNFVYIRAKNDISNLNIKVDANIDFHYQQSGGNSNSKVVFQLWYAIWQGNTFDFSQEYGILYQKDLMGTSTQDFNINQVFNFNFPSLKRDFNFSIFWSFAYGSEHINRTTWTFNKSTIYAEAVETAIPTVAKGVRWIDGIRQADKFVSNLGVNASLFDVGGVHYNNVLFGREQISQRINNFNSTPKAMYESVEEVNCDYEPDENEIFIGHQSDFYENVEIGVFNIIPDEDFSIQENDRCMINKFQYKYKNFQQDRTVLGTSEAIHTDSEWRFLNDQVENVKEVAIDFVRDPLTIQAMVDLEITQPTTSTSDDDKVYISEIVPLAPSSFNEFGALLLIRINGGKVEILNRDSNGDSGNVVINWTILGLSVGGNFQITFGQNVGNYTIFSLTNSVISLTPIGFTPTFNGDAFIKVKYFYTNVLWVTRTNEGFISNPLGLQNANYSIKRNMGYFGEYFASCLLYEKSNIINAYFKSNGTYTSQLTTEAFPITENANIVFSDLPKPLTTAKILTLNCVAEFENILTYLQTYKINRGFIRTFDSYGRVIKGYVQKLDHLWQENNLKLVLEEKYEDENLILTFSSGILTVNDAVYNLSGVSDWWKFENDYIKLYDSQSRPLSNYYRYNFVSLNGVIYATKNDLITALLNLI